MSWVVWLPLACAGCVAIVLGLAAYGASRWAEATRVLQAQLDAARVTLAPSHYDVRELEGLPAPVQRYFRAVLKDGQPMITAVTMQQRGTMNLSAKGAQWKPFSAQQRVVTRRPGFVWNGRIAIMPGIAVHVYDAYVAGVGLLKPAILGLYALANVRGTGEIARAELIRYFAEAAWYPTALLPSQGVQWTASNDRAAIATMSDGPLSVTMEVTFDDEGLIACARFASRSATVGDHGEPIPWEGRWADYQARSGMRVPLTGEAVWVHPGGRKPYWRGSITSLTYEFAH